MKIQKCINRPLVDSARPTIFFSENCNYKNLHKYIKYLKSYCKINSFGAEIMKKRKKKRGFALEMSDSEFQNKR